MNEEARLIPDRWHARGEAVADREGRQWVVWQGIPGEPCVARHVGGGAHAEHFRFVDTPKPHPTRVTPPCDRVNQCGGCPIMHLNAEGQERMRRSVVRKALDEAGLNEVEVGHFHANRDGLADFRHVVKVGFGRSERGNLRVGAWGRYDRRIVAIPDCNVAAPVLRKAMNALAHHTIELDIRPYDVDADNGVLRAAILRASRTTGEVLITLVAGRRIPLLDELAERLGLMSEVAGVWLHLNSEPGNAILHRDEDGEVGMRPLVGRAYIEERIGEITYRIGPADFFQTNPGMAEQLYARTLSRLALKQGDPFVDLYCGVGGLALQAAKTTGWALGVEEIASAVTSARETARRHELPAQFVPGRVEDALTDMQRRLAGMAPIVAVNPARRGLEPGVVDQILSLAPRRIAYVSCNPAALARDLALFAAGGMNIGTVEMFDMFPNTAHVECLVVLEASEPVAAERRAPRRKVVRGTP